MTKGSTRYTNMHIIFSDFEIETELSSNYSGFGLFKQPASSSAFTEFIEISRTERNT
jgi:hypothetical protein